MNYVEHEFEIVEFANTDVLVNCAMSFGGEGSSPWSIRPETSDM